MLTEIQNDLIKIAMKKSNIAIKAFSEKKHRLFLDNANQIIGLTEASMQLVGRNSELVKELIRIQTQVINLTKKQ